MTHSASPLKVVFPTEALLYSAYMPFIKGGGLFVRTQTLYTLGTNIPLSVQLLSEPTIYEFEGQVVWITPKGAQGNKPMGVGVQCLGERGRACSSAIETLLAGQLQSTQATDTL